MRKSGSRSSYSFHHTPCGKWPRHLMQSSIVKGQAPEWHRAVREVLWWDPGRLRCQQCAGGHRRKRNLLWRVARWTTTSETTGAGQPFGRSHCSGVPQIPGMEPGDLELVLLGFHVPWAALSFLFLSFLPSWGRNIYLCLPPSLDLRSI